MTTIDEDLLIRYVRAALEKIENGEPVDLREICGNNVAMAHAVAEAVGIRSDLASIGREVSDTDPRIGRVLGHRYRLDDALGRGAMGVVYRATDEELQRVVAVKLFDTFSGPSERAESRFLREAEMLAKLENEHIVTVHDRGREDDGTLWLVMDHLRGATLAELLTQNEDRSADQDLSAFLSGTLGEGTPEPPETGWLRTVVRWAADVARGLDAAHDAGVFHRDVKPSNIFIRHDLRAVLLDFGIAARATDPALTASDTALGTPWYMAPEQATGDERTSATIDVYGLSATLYHLLTGKPPLEGDAAQVIAKLQKQDPEPPSKANPALPRDLCAIIEKGMERDPNRRYRSVAALETDLRAFLEHRPVTARPLSTLGRTWRRVRRGPLRFVAAAAIVAALALGYLLYDNVQTTANQREHFQLFARLPKLLAIEGKPSQRLLVDRGERDESIRLLDRLLELDADDLPSRLWRAALHLDQGRTDEAHDDLAELVNRSDGSPYVAEVARRYAKADRRGTKAVDLSDLPEPKTRFDWFMAGFHELRNRHVAGFSKRALEALDRVEDYVPARDLRLIALVGAGQWQKAHDESLKLEGIYGEPTARTLAIRGVALIKLKRFEDALDCLLRSDSMRPDRHGPIHNLGVVHKRLGQPEKALEYLDRAAELRPFFLNTQVERVYTLRDLGRFDDALATIETLPDDGSGELEWRRPELIGTVHFRRAVNRLEAEGQAASQADAEIAATHYQQAVEKAPPRTAKIFAGRLAATRALATADRTQAANELLDRLSKEPIDAYQIANLASLLPDTMDRDTVWFLKWWLRRTALRLAPGDSTLKAQQLEALKRAMPNRPK